MLHDLFICDPILLNNTTAYAREYLEISNRKDCKECLFYKENDICGFCECNYDKSYLPYKE